MLGYFKWPDNQFKKVMNNFNVKLSANKAKQHRALRALDLATLGRCWRR
jgi:hypothetical protein